MNYDEYFQLEKFLESTNLPISMEQLINRDITRKTKEQVMTIIKDFAIDYDNLIVKYRSLIILYENEKIKRKIEGISNPVNYNHIRYFDKK